MSAKELTDTGERYRYKTSSAIPNPAMLSREPLVFILGKTKDNAFQRGVTVGRTGRRFGP